MGTCRPLRTGECLSERYVNNETKLRWRCAKGHEWEAVPASVIKGSWCPQCAILNQTRARNGWKRGRYEATGKLAGG
ncbi:zinc-ribbon domain-containing protein [Paraburkholderia adhaesiva]|uniref:zinc-ribbon domain-containing protein n=1 Tax=Paraburkholderia adhaesiva TaxID=2883244 RepID=UPI003570CF53